MNQKNVLRYSEKIESIVQSKNCSYIDACVVLCEEEEIEHELLGQIILKNQQLVLKLQKEAEDLNIIKKEVRIKI